MWLDDAAWGRNSGRIVRRFFGGAWSTARSQRDLRSFFRFRDYGRHLRELFAAIPQSRRYETAPAGSDEVTRKDVAERLRPVRVEGRPLLEPGRDEDPSSASCVRSRPDQVEVAADQAAESVNIGLKVVTQTPSRVRRQLPSACRCGC